MAIPAIIKALSKVSSEVSTAKNVAEGNVESIATKGISKGMSSKFNPDKRIESKPNDYPKAGDQKYNPDKRIDHIATKEEISEKQQKSIKEFEENREQYLDKSQAKGNYGEMKVDQDLSHKGLDKISNDDVTDLSTPTNQGIDSVWMDKETGKTSIVEVKCNQSQLGDTLDGKQMSSEWIDNRLDDAVGKEMADKIRMNSITDPDSVKSVLAKVDLDGNISYFELDGAANVIGGIEL